MICNSVEQQDKVARTLGNITAAQAAWRELGKGENRKDLTKRAHYLLGNSTLMSGDPKLLAMLKAFSDDS